MINYFDLGVFDGREIDSFIRVMEDLNQDYRVIGFEAFPEVANKLIDKYKHNAKVTIHPYAISGTEGEIKIYISDAPQGHSIYSSKNNCGGVECHVVKSVKLSSYIESGNNILRFNIEGAELPMMEDLIETEKYKDINVFLGAGIGVDIRKCSEIAGELPRYLKMLKDYDIKIEHWCADTPNQNIDINEKIKGLLNV